MAVVLAVGVGGEVGADPVDPHLFRVTGGRTPTALEVVDAFHHAWNVGDLAGWEAFLGDDPDDVLGPELPSGLSPHAALMAAGSRVERTGDCRRRDGTEDGVVRVTCPIRVDDHFADGPLSLQVELVVDPDGPRWVRYATPPVERELRLRAHAAAFRAWLEATRPDLAAQFGLPTVPLQLPNRADMPTAVVLQDDYLVDAGG